MSQQKAPQAIPERYAVKATDDGKFQVVSQYEQGVFCTCLSHEEAAKVTAYLNKTRRR